MRSLFQMARSFLTARNLFTYLTLLGLPLASAFAQSISAFHPNQEVQVSGLPALTAPSTKKSAVLATVIETVLQDKAVCCGKDSALEDAVHSHPASLKELGVKLQGRHVMSDGRSVMVSAQYVPQSSITPDLMISILMDQHAPLMAWKSQTYVLYGVIFDETIFSDGRRQHTIHKLLLLDPRFSDERRETEFNRDTDDWGNVEGILTLTAARQ
jgi:hypothetical protein